MPQSFCPFEENMAHAPASTSPHNCSIPLQPFSQKHLLGLSCQAKGHFIPGQLFRKGPGWHQAPQWLCPAGWVLINREGKKGTALQTHLCASGPVTHARKFKEFGSKCFSEAKTFCFKTFLISLSLKKKKNKTKNHHKTNKSPTSATGSKILADTCEPLLTHGPVNVLLRDKPYSRTVHPAVIPCNGKLPKNQPKQIFGGKAGAAWREGLGQECSCHRAGGDIIQIPS